MMQIKKLNKGIQDEWLKPATQHSAGLDLRVMEPINVFPGQQVMVGTGIAVAIPPKHVGKVYVRSSIGNRGVVLGNGTGIIDADYRGEIKLILVNRNPEGMPIEFNQYERIAQLVVVPIVPPHYEVVDELSETDRSYNGFGSTGKQ